MSNIYVDVNRVSKKFCRDLKRSAWYGLREIGKEFLNQPLTGQELHVGEFWALHDVSFKLRKGDALGLLGRNGAGKTTLLRLLNGVVYPDSGVTKIRGLVAPLIELGAGFAPILSGRENIYVNAAILGLTAKAIDALIDRIVDFAEMSDSIDAPMQSYSEGMKARLGFAIAAHLDPDIMLVDEVLAVGDLGFQRKCLNHIESFLGRGGILIFVSHNMHMVQSICQRCLVLDRGEVIFDGATAAAVERYARLNDLERASVSSQVYAEPNESDPVIIESVRVDPLGASEIQSGEPFKITLSYRSVKALGPVTWGVSLWTNDQEVRIGTALAKYHGKSHTISPGGGQLCCIVRNLPLVPGIYCVKSGIYDSQRGWPIARFGWENPASGFEVTGALTEANSRHRIDGDILHLDVEWVN